MQAQRQAVRAAIQVEIIAAYQSLTIFAAKGQDAKARRDHARNSVALSVAHCRNVFAGAPVISATVEVTCAGWLKAAAQASSSIFIAGRDPTLSNSRRASSGEISTMRRERPITRPIVDTCSNWLNDSGPVKTYSAPACPSSHSARIATAAISRSSIGAVGAVRYGQRTTSPTRICGAHQLKAFAANIPGRRNVHWTPEVSIKRSICSNITRSGLGC